MKLLIQPALDHNVSIPSLSPYPTAQISWDKTHMFQLFCFETYHTSVMGSLRHPSHDTFQRISSDNLYLGKEYFLVISDYFTFYIWIDYINRKNVGTDPLKWRLSRGDEWNLRQRSNWFRIHYRYTNDFPAWARYYPYQDPDLFRRHQWQGRAQPSSVICISYVFLIYLLHIKTDLITCILSP